jgi:60 kDa SS-A/Ro ribonucleoprotein
MSDSLTAISTRRTPQSEKADPRQKPNNAGGYAFKVSDDGQVHRFLTLGVSSGTYYVSERELTQANAEVVLANAAGRGTWLVERIVEVSTAGRAPRQNPAIFALAAASALADDAGRKAAFDAVPAVCRTATHLFLFAKYRQQFAGWGRGARRAFSGWFTGREPDQLAYQMLKYRNREGWTHRDILRKAHPLTGVDSSTVDPAMRALFDWTCGRDVDLNTTPALVGAFERAQKTTDVAEWVSLATEFPLSWEMLPDAALGKPEVWRALIARGMPQTALMRQLPRLTRLGVLDGDTRTKVVAQLTDADRLRKGRVHPINILVALRTYASGQSMRGSSTWTPDRRIIDALDAAFYAAFATLEPANKRTLLALDVSGSMGSYASGLPITCREVTAALALVTMATEPQCDVIGFTGGGMNYWGGRRTSQTNPLQAVSELAISPRQRLDDAVRSIANLPFGATDCALPMIWAEKTKREYDTIQVLTDNETWAGDIHPHQALNGYRQRMGIDTRLAVIGMTATDVTIADPDDPGSLDIAGFDSAVPNLVADFSRRTI